MGKLDGKVAVVTGGNSGIGLAIARAFSVEGAQVSIFGRDAGSLEATRRELASNCLTTVGDVRSLSDLRMLIEETYDAFGAIDILVVNAGGATIESFDEVGEESFNYQSDVNFKGAFFTIQAALPRLSRGSSIILTSSSANCRAAPGMSVYGAAKAAVRSLARSLAVEFAERGIRVNVLTPGPVETPAYARTGLSASKVAEFQQSQAAQSPMGRIGQPSEIASAALFLATQSSSYMTGAELVVDGGITQI